MQSDEGTARTALDCCLYAILSNGHRSNWLRIIGSARPEPENFLLEIRQRDT